MDYFNKKFDFKHVQGHVVLYKRTCIIHKCIDISLHYKCVCINIHVFVCRIKMYLCKSWCRNQITKDQILSKSKMVECHST